jgi:pyridoxal phosphate enzyme (YggS family)
VTNTIAHRLATVRHRIVAAAEQAGRDPGGVTLVAVTKTHPVEVVTEAVAAGVADVGENRVQEAEAKRHRLPPVRWHLIGPLQRNKVRSALELFDVVHTCDRPELVERLAFLLDRDWPERRLPVLIEVNIGREAQKAGVLPDQAEHLLQTARACPQLEVVGLMAIPPFETDPDASRPHFRALHRLREELQDRLGAPLPQLSMGMSLDYEVAIAEGATLVRIGTAIFGQRG